MKTLGEIEAEVNRLANKVGATANELPAFGTTRDGAQPHIEVVGSRYHYVVVERGEELERKSTTDFAELLYWVFADVTHSMAFTYKLNHRVNDQDCRRIAFPKQIELLNVISSQMSARRAAEIAEILRKAPYDDEPTKALNRMRDANAT